MKSRRTLPAITHRAPTIEPPVYKKSTILVLIGIVALSCMFLLGQDDWTTREREACCFPDGGCAFVYPDNCNDQNGTLQGPGTDCSTNPCPLPPEACCMPDGTCEDVTPTSCNGNPQGPGTDCATAVCPQAANVAELISVLPAHTRGAMAAHMRSLLTGSSSAHVTALLDGTGTDAALNEPFRAIKVLSLGIDLQGVMETALLAQTTNPKTDSSWPQS